MFALAGFSQVKWDAKVGMSMTNLTGDMDGDMKIGYNVGVGMDYAFSEDWSLQSGLNFTGKGAKDEGVKVKMNYVDSYLGCIQICFRRKYEVRCKCRSLLGCWIRR